MSNEWPTSSVPTNDLDSASDSPAAGRAAIKTMADVVNAMRTAAEWGQVYGNSLSPAQVIPDQTWTKVAVFNAVQGNTTHESFTLDHANDRIVINTSLTAVVRVTGGVVVQSPVGICAARIRVNGGTADGRAAQPCGNYGNAFVTVQTMLQYPVAGTIIEMDVWHNAGVDVNVITFDGAFKPYLQIELVR